MFLHQEMRNILLPECYLFNQQNMATYKQGVERYIPNLLSVSRELLNVELEILKAQWWVSEKTGSVGIHQKMLQHKTHGF